MNFFSLWPTVLLNFDRQLHRLVLLIISDRRGKKTSNVNFDWIELQTFNYVSCSSDKCERSFLQEGSQPVFACFEGSDSKSWLIFFLTFAAAKSVTFFLSSQSIKTVCAWYLNCSLSSLWCDVNVICPKHKQKKNQTNKGRKLRSKRSGAPRRRPSSTGGAAHQITVSCSNGPTERH